MKIHGDMNIYEEIKKLKEKNVYIDFNHEYYPDGANCLFSINFLNTKFETGKDSDKTGWYGDNHEFGDTEDVMIKAIDVANFLISDEKYLKYYFMAVTAESIPIKEEIRKFIYNF